jgi:hypothetical protein
MSVRSVLPHSGGCKTPGLMRRSSVSLADDTPLRIHFSRILQAAAGSHKIVPIPAEPDHRLASPRRPR